MSTMPTTIEGALATEPGWLKDRLSVAARRAAGEIAGRVLVKQGLAATDLIAPGRVIQDEAGAMQNSDATAAVIGAERDIEDQLNELLSIPRAMEAAARSALVDVRAVLAAARKRGNDARVAWQMELGRRARAEEDRLRREAQERADADAEFGGLNAPPPVEVATVEAPRIVRGGAGAQGTQVRVRAVEITSDADCPAEWKTLVAGLPAAAFVAAVVRGEAKKPAAGDSVVWRGVRFESYMTAVNRRA